MQNFGVTNKEYYGMLWYFWSGQLDDTNSGYQITLKTRCDILSVCKIKTQDIPRGFFFCYKRQPHPRAHANESFVQ